MGAFGIDECSRVGFGDERDPRPWDVGRRRAGWLAGWLGQGPRAQRVCVQSKTHFQLLRPLRSNLLPRLGRRCLEIELHHRAPCIEIIPECSV